MPDRTGETPPPYDWPNGLPSWVEVASAHARPEPSSRLGVAGLDGAQCARLARTAFHYGGKTTAMMYDYAGRSICAIGGLMDYKMRAANHAAYAGWITSTLMDPLEVWLHEDRKAKALTHRPHRLHYLSAYRGELGITSHLVVVALESQIANACLLVTAFPPTNPGNAQARRYGGLLHMGYHRGRTRRMSRAEMRSFQFAPITGMPTAPGDCEE